MAAYKIGAQDTFLVDRGPRHRCRWQVAKCGDWTLVGTLPRSESFFLLDFKSQCFQCDVCLIIVSEIGVDNQTHRKSAESIILTRSRFAESISVLARIAESIFRTL